MSTLSTLIDSVKALEKWLARPRFNRAILWLFILFFPGAAILAIIDTWIINLPRGGALAYSSLLLFALAWFCPYAILTIFLILGPWIVAMIGAVNNTPYWENFWYWPISTIIFSMGIFTFIRLTKIEKNW